jgi:thiol peroxidase
MAETKLMGKTVKTSGDIPALGIAATDYCLTANNLKDKSLANLNGGKKLISTLPSLDTSVCAVSTQRLNELAKDFSDATFITVSADLPFAQQRFCKEHKISNITMLSTMRDDNFARDYGVLMQDGAMAGLLARAIFIIDASNKIVYTELVSDIVNEPDYEMAISALQNC